MISPSTSANDRSTKAGVSRPFHHASPPIAKAMRLSMAGPLSSTLHHLNTSELCANGLINALNSTQTSKKSRGKCRDSTLFMHALKGLLFCDVDFTEKKGTNTLRANLKLRLKQRAKGGLNQLIVSIDTCTGFDDGDLQEIEKKGWEK
jgi:exonuclease V gamma subunit